MLCPLRAHLREQSLSQNSPDRLRPRRLRLRLLRDPGIQRRLQLRVEPQADVRPDPRLRSPSSSFLGTGYCSAPEIMVPENHRTGARRLPCPGSDHHTPSSRRRRMAAGDQNPSRRALLGAAGGVPLASSFPRKRESRCSSEGEGRWIPDQVRDDGADQVPGDGEWMEALARFRAAEAEMRGVERATAGGSVEEEEIWLPIY